MLRNRQITHMQATRNRRRILNDGGVALATENQQLTKHDRVSVVGPPLWAAAQPILNYIISHVSYHVTFQSRVAPPETKAVSVGSSGLEGRVSLDILPLYAFYA